MSQPVTSLKLSQQKQLSVSCQSILIPKMSKVVALVSAEVSLLQMTSVPKRTHHGTLSALLIDLNSFFQSKSIDIVFISPQKHILWVLIGSASARHF